MTFEKSELPERYSKKVSTEIVSLIKQFLAEEDCDVVIIKDWDKNYDNIGNFVTFTRKIISDYFQGEVKVIQRGKQPYLIRLKGGEA